MRFLIDENLPRRVGELLQAHGHESLDVRDIDLRGASDAEIAAYAKAEGLCLLTRDAGFGDVRAYPPAEYAGIVVVDLPARASVDLIEQVVVGFIQQEQVLAALPGHLAIVQPGQIRLR